MSEHLKFSISKSGLLHHYITHKLLFIKFMCCLTSSNSGEFKNDLKHEKKKKKKKKG